MSSTAAAAAATTTKVPPLDTRAALYMTLLAVQFGVQPIVTRRYAPTGITRSTFVLMQEAVKFCIAGSFLFLSGNADKAVQTWTLRSWVTVAFVPAALYSVQNMAALTAYQNLDALTFNVLNQTKTLSAALCCFLVMGRKQSPMQIVALILLLQSALVMEGIIPVEEWLGYKTAVAAAAVEETQSSDNSAAWSRRFTLGIVPILIASFISGLAGALTQKSLQAAAGARNSYLFSMELCAATTVFVGSSLFVSADGVAVKEHGFWYRWTAQTWIPIATGAAGGVLVGLVTKYAGSVRKGFALIFGMLLSGLLQMGETGERIGVKQVMGGLLAAVSLYMHSTNPPSSSSSAAAATISVDKKQK